MKLTIIAVGKIKSRPIQEMADDYASRLSHYMPSNVIAVRDDLKALEKIDGTDYLIVLDERGERMSSKGLAKLLSDHQSKGTKHMAMFIGGPDGVGDVLKERADFTLSLSRMTFPHELVQAMLLEQLYRACSINRGEPYHRE